MPSALKSNRITYIRGFAILAVVVIHVLSSLPGRIFAQTDQNTLYILIDQFCRLSVPLFLGVSGFGLMKKYEKDFNLVQFFQRRVLRLVPLYLLWTVGLWLLFRLIPGWYNTAEPVPIWQAIIFGSDYHLYFVPLIFEFYFLFPVLLFFVRKMPMATLLASIALQAGSIVFFQWQAEQSTPKLFTTDQEQYLLFISWLSYFVIGMVIAKEKVKVSGKMILLSCAIWLLSYYGMVTQAIENIAGGLDPLYALKFTRLLVIPFGLSSIVIALMLAIKNFGAPQPLLQLLKKIGELSFIIFLSHTVILRIIFGREILGVSSGDILLAATFMVLLIGISLKLEKN